MFSVLANPIDHDSERIYMEQEIYCARPDERVTVKGRGAVNMGGPIKVFRADETRVTDLLQFWSSEGGKRTIEVDQVLGVYPKPHLQRG